HSWYIDKRHEEELILLIIKAGDDGPRKLHRQPYLFVPSLHRDACHLCLLLSKESKESVIIFLQQYYKQEPTTPSGDALRFVRMPKRLPRVYALLPAMLDNSLCNYPSYCVWALSIAKTVLIV